MAGEKVIGFRIDINGTQEQITKITGLKQSINDLTTKIKDMASGRDWKTGKFVPVDQAEIARAEAELRGLKTELREVSKEVDRANNVFRAESGSMTELNNALNLNRQAFRDLSAEERNNAEIGGKLQQTIAQQDAELKKLDADMGMYQRNVGNYGLATGGLVTEFQKAMAAMKSMEVQGDQNTQAYLEQKAAADGMSAELQTVAAGSLLSSYLR